MRDIPFENIICDKSIEFSDVDLIKIDDYYYAVFDNLKIFNGNYNLEKIDGKVMPLFFSNKYFHMLLDNLALGEYTASKINDLKFQFFVIQMPIHNELNKEINRNAKSFIKFLKNKRFDNTQFAYDEKNNFEYFEDILKIYNNDFLIYDQCINVEMKKCFIFIGNDEDLLKLYNYDKKIFVNYYFGEGTRDYAKGYTNHKWSIDGLNILKKKLSNVVDVEKSDRKIYVSRLQASKMYSREKNPSLSEKILDKEYDVESIFNENGFESITLEGLSFLEQFKVFNQAKTVAGYNGTNLLNIVLSNNKINIIEVIGENSSGHFDYQTFARIMGHSHKFIKENDIISNRSVS